MSSTITSTNDLGAAAAVKTADDAVAAVVSADDDDNLHDIVDYNFVVGLVKFGESEYKRTV